MRTNFVGGAGRSKMRYELIRGLCFILISSILGKAHQRQMILGILLPTLVIVVEVNLSAC